MLTDEIKTAYHRAKWGVAVRGLIAILIGVLILVRPLASVAALALVVAIWALVEGIVTIVHSFDVRKVAEHWWVMLLAGIVSVAFGIAALYYYPALSLAFIIVWVAWWFIAGGVLGAYIAFMERKAGVSWGWTMVWSVLALVTGVLAFMFPGITLVALMGMLAAFGIVGGIVRLVAFFRMQSLEGELKRGAPGAARS